MNQKTKKTQTQSRNPRRIPDFRRKNVRNTTKYPKQTRQMERAQGNTSKNTKLRVAIIGGAEEVGRNMTLVEYGNDIVLLDIGLQFPEEDMPGIDYIIPNISYLKGKEKNVRGVIITHGHYDHIGGISHIVPKIGNPPVFGTKLTLGIIKKRHEDYHDKQPLRLKAIDDNTILQLGNIKLEFIRINHNIPDCVAVAFHTPEGTIIHTGDFKFDYTPIIDKPADLSKFARLGDRGVLALLCDSTNSDQPGQQLSESAIGENLRQIFIHAKGRIIIGTFASLLTRVQQVIKLAEEYGRKVVIDGYGMKSNVEIAKQLGYLKYNPKTLISPQVAKKLPNDKVVIMGTGAQGEDRAVLMRMANRDHRFFRIEKEDTVIFSSSVVPGNERTVQKLRDALTKEGAHIYHYRMMDVHAGGHARKEDLKLLFQLTKPKYIIPVEGNRYLLEAAGRVAQEVGYKKENIFITDNGRFMEFKNGRGTLTSKKAPSDYVMVDGLGVGDVSNVVLRDRQMMSSDGMFVIIATIDSRTGELLGSPDIISRGFVYMKGNKELISEVRKKIKVILKDKNPNMAAAEAHIKNKIRNEIGDFLFQKIQRRPMVLPVLIEV